MTDAQAPQAPGVPAYPEQETGASTVAQPPVGQPEFAPPPPPDSHQSHVESMLELAREATTILPLEELLQGFVPLDQKLTIQDLIEEKKLRRGLGRSGIQSRIQNELLMLEQEFQYQMPMTLNIQGVVEQLGNLSSLLSTVTQKMSDAKLYFERSKKRRLSIYRAALRVAVGTVEEKKAYAEDIASNSLQDVEMDMAQDKYMKLEAIFNGLDGQFHALRKMANLIELETQLRFGSGRFRE